MKGFERKKGIRGICEMETNIVMFDSCEFEDVMSFRFRIEAEKYVDCNLN